MSEEKRITIPINIRDWVLSVDVGPIRRQRRAIEIALNTIATCDDLATSCSLKGGILMGLLHGVRRHINCLRFWPGLRETLLTFLFDIKRRLCGIASVDARLSSV